MEGSFLHHFGKKVEPVGHSVPRATQGTEMARAMVDKVIETFTYASELQS
jgi:hypothetical protein